MSDLPCLPCPCPPPYPTIAPTESFISSHSRPLLRRWLSDPNSGCRYGDCCQIQSYPHCPVLALVPRRFPMPAPFPALLYSARLLRKTSGSESSRNCPVLVQRRLPTSPVVPHSPAGGRLRAQIGVGVVTDMPVQVSNAHPSIFPHLRFRRLLVIFFTGGWGKGIR